MIEDSMQQISPSTENWKISVDNENIAFLGFDRQDSSTNTLSKKCLIDLNKIIDEKVITNKNIIGVVFYSCKSNGFIAGADVNEFKNLDDEKKVQEFLDLGQEVFAKIAGLKITTLALIEGFCLGGGLELSLACDYRIGIESNSTKLGLPEVKLGIVPGWGGTVRLTRLIGAKDSLGLILQGSIIDGYKAKKLGILDAYLPQRNVASAVSYYMRETPKRKPSYFNKFMKLDLARKGFAKLVKRQFPDYIKEQFYPAPFLALQNWVKNGESDKGFTGEKDAVMHLAEQSQTRNLLRLFFLREVLKDFGKKSKRKISHVHVIGAGVMGGDIAAFCALKGMTVSLQDNKPNAVANTLKRADELFTKKLKKPHLINSCKDRMYVDPNGDLVEQADLIIEAVIEDLELKKKIFLEVENKAKPDAILATNTSTIPLEEICSNMKYPDRLVGIHFFNPVAKMDLVEVVKGKKTDVKIYNDATHFVNLIGKLPIPVASSPGFLVNRLLLPYLSEAILILQEGVPAYYIDKCMKDFGMPMGPIELADLVGIDVCQLAGKSMAKYFPLQMPELIDEMVAANKLGKKTNEGFYTYKNGKKISKKYESHYQPPKDISDRLILRILNEAVACLREKVVTSEDLIDAGMVFGSGFAPFLGGPMHYMHSCGKEAILSKLESFSKQYGVRFKLDAGWQKI